MKRYGLPLCALFVASVLVGCGAGGSSSTANTKGGLVEPTPELKDYMKSAGGKMSGKGNPNKAARKN